MNEKEALEILKDGIENLDLPALKPVYEVAIKALEKQISLKRIVERLESNSFFTEPTYDMDGYSNDDEFEVIRLDKAIEIVKEEGGLNDI